MDLVDALLLDSESFSEEGRAHDLLQEFFRGRSLEDLRPLLLHGDQMVRRSAAFIASELGSSCSVLVDAIVPLLRDDDRHAQWYATESVSLVASEKPDVFIHVVLQLENEDDAICRLAMRLMSRVDTCRLDLDGGLVARFSDESSRHIEGLKLLVDGDLVEDFQIRDCLKSSNAILRKYGAVASVRLRERDPGLLDEALESEDPVISRFALEAAK